MESEGRRVDKGEVMKRKGRYEKVKGGRSEETE